ncbi:hypothetical protein KBB74_02185 [Candidatus Parcubacteria bacterium]|nr:hypothetical protein [Candidatus Parcubacteria bacterium]
MIRKKEIKDSRQASDAYYRCDTKDRKFILDKWNEMFMPKALEFMNKKEADLLFEKDIKEFFAFVDDCYFPISGKVPDLANEIADHICEFLITSSKQATDLYKSKVYDKSKIGFSQLEERWNDLFAIDLLKARNFEDIEKISSYCSPRYFRSQLFERWCDYSFSIEHLKRIKKFISNSYIDPDSSVFDKIHKRAEDLFVEFISKTDDILTIKEYYLYTPASSITKKMAFRRWVLLCTTFDEITEAFRLRPPDDEAETICHTQAEEILKTY